MTDTDIKALKDQLALEQKRVKELEAERGDLGVWSWKDALEASRAELQQLRAELATAQKERDTCRAVIKSDCESLEQAKASLRGVLTDHEIDGDSYMVPCAFVLITTLKEKLDQLRAERDELRRFIRRVTLEIQQHRLRSDAQKDALFQESYRVYVKYKADEMFDAKAALTESQKGLDATPGSPAL